MTNDNFVPALAGGQLGGARSDFVIVEWADSGESEPCTRLFGIASA